jgi:nitrogen fixation NifU-like protein
MTDLEELYQDMIMEHNRKPRNFRLLEGADRSADGFNPFCGDTISLYLILDGDQVADIAFQGSGCAISRASASMLTESVKGKRLAEAEQLFDAFHEMLTQGPVDEPDHDHDDDDDILGDLGMLSGVSAFPTRVKCATLSWNTLKAALQGDKGTVRTE